MPTERQFVKYCILYEGTESSGVNSPNGSCYADKYISERSVGFAPKIR